MHLSIQVSLCRTRNYFSATSFLKPVNLTISEEILLQLSYIRDKGINKIKLFTNPVGITGFRIGKQNRTNVVFPKPVLYF